MRQVTYYTRMVPMRFVRIGISEFPLEQAWRVISSAAKTNVVSRVAVSQKDEEFVLAAVTISALVTTGKPGSMKVYRGEDFDLFHDEISIALESR